MTCPEGQFQGYTIWLIRPGQPKKMIGFSSSCRFVVTEPLPAPGTAEVWTFEVHTSIKTSPSAKSPSRLI